MRIKDDFNIESILERWRPDFRQYSSKVKPIKRIEISKVDINDEMLERHYLFIARIVDQYGDTYLPIFERLHAEVEKRIKSKAMLETALKVSQKMNRSDNPKLQKQSYPDTFS